MIEKDGRKDINYLKDLEFQIVSEKAKKQQ
jgi:hypothetical protein